MNPSVSIDTQLLLSQIVITHKAAMLSLANWMSHVFVTFRTLARHRQLSAKCSQEGEVVVPGWEEATVLHRETGRHHPAPRPPTKASRSVYLPTMTCRSVYLPQTSHQDQPVSLSSPDLPPSPGGQFIFPLWPAGQFIFPRPPTKASRSVYLPQTSHQDLVVSLSSPDLPPRPRGQFIFSRTPIKT